MSVAFIGLGRFDEAVVAAKKAVRQNQLYSFAYRCLASALAHLGREAEAREAVASLLELEPDFRISEWIARGDGLRLQIVYRRPPQSRTSRVTRRPVSRHQRFDRVGRDRDFRFGHDTTPNEHNG